MRLRAHQGGIAEPADFSRRTPRRTDPNDPKSTFAIQDYTAEQTANGLQISISWDTMPDRIYNVFATDTLTSWPTTPARQVSGDGNRATVKVPIAGKKAFFLRVEVQVVNP